MTVDDDLRHLARAAELSRARMEAGLGGPFGAVIVRDGVVLAEGCSVQRSSGVAVRAVETGGGTEAMAGTATGRAAGEGVALAANCCR